MELFTERLKLKDVMPEVAVDIAKEYSLKEEDLELVRKNNPLKSEDIKIEDGERAAVRYVNTADVDRDKEIVMPDGLQTKDFLKSPSVLYAHNYRGLPIGRDIWLKLIKGKGWLAKTIYAEHELANDVYNLVKDKFLNTNSIGFIPLESVKPDSKKWDKVKAKLISEYGIKEKLIDKVSRIYTQSILLEHSDVPIPSNINALNIAVGKGFIKSDQLIKDLEIEIIDEEKEEVKLSEGDKEKLEEGLKDVKENKVEKVDIDKLEKEIDEEGEAVKLENVEKPYPNEHSCRIRPPGGFQPGSFRRMTRRHDGKEYSVIMGRLKGETTMTEQAYRYGIKVWTVSQARKHCKDHKGILFEPATGKESEDMDKELDSVIVKFHGSPRNPFGTHCSFRFKGGIAGYKKSWTLHCSQINGGALTPAASGPIRGTVRRIAMISAGMKPPCKVAEAEGMGARGGAKSPLPGTYPEKPSDYGLSSWLKPGDEEVDPKKALQFTCSDLNTIKRICVMEIKRRIKDREAAEGKGISKEEIEFFEGLTDLESTQQIISEEETGSEEETIDLTNIVATVKVTDLEEFKAIIKKATKQEQELIKLKEEYKELELKAGAVLNRKNKTDLTNAQKLIQNVLDSAATAEEGKQTYNCECIECGYKITSDKHCDTLKCPKCGGDMRRAERPGPGKETDELEIEEDNIDTEIKDDGDNDPEEKEETIDISEDEIKGIISEVLNGKIGKLTDTLKKEVGDNFKKMTGKVI